MTTTTPHQRLARMRASFEKNKSVLADDYAYFVTPAMPHVPSPQSTAEHRSEERYVKQSQERSETQSSGKTGD